MASEFLLRGHDVILDFGFWTRTGRDEYRAMAQAIGVDSIIYSMKTDYETCKRRALKRTDEMPDGELFIDETALTMFWQRFEPLSTDEKSISI